MSQVDLGKKDDNAGDYKGIDDDYDDVQREAIFSDVSHDKLNFYFPADLDGVDRMRYMMPLAFSTSQSDNFADKGGNF